MGNIKAILTCALIFTCFGCASIVSESQYPVLINTTPSGAKVKIKDQYGTVIHDTTTPTTLTLVSSRGFFKPASYICTFEKEDCIPSELSISAGLDPWYAGNIALGGFGIIGMVFVDPFTGAMWKLEDSIQCNLVSQSLDKKMRQSLDKKRRIIELTD